MAANCEKVIRELFAAWTRLNLDEVMSYFAEDAVMGQRPHVSRKRQTGDP